MLVVWFHAMFLVKERYLGAFQTDFAFLSSLGAVGVDLFFMISGFVVTLAALRARTVASFLCDRMLRIWPPYIVATLAYLAVQPSEVGRPGRLLASLLFIEPFDTVSPYPTLEPGWSLMFEVAFYILISAAMMWRTSGSLGQRIGIIMAGFILLGSLIGYPRPLNILANPIALEFLFGVAIAYVWQRYPTLPAWSSSAMFLGGTLALLWTALHGPEVWDAVKVLEGGPSWARLRVWGGGAALIVASAVFRKQPRASTLLVFLGDASYSIYLFHMHVITWFSKHWGVLAVFSPDVAILVATACATAGGTLMYVSVERPMMKALHELRSRRKAAIVAVSP